MFCTTKLTTFEVIIKRKSMMYDPENKIVTLCSLGMSLEGEGKMKEALQLFEQAWNESTTDFEKFTAAHYVARHQNSVLDKLKWDEIALNFASKIKDDNLKGAFPSLYLNIGKCYEDLNNFEKAKEHYNLALLYSDRLNEDGYGKMIKTGILNGLERLKQV